MKKVKTIYQAPMTEVVRVQMGAHLLDSSQSWPDPAQAPLNAERKGYGTGVGVEW